MVTNAELEPLLETTDAWIRERTGIREPAAGVEGRLHGRLGRAGGRQAARRARWPTPASAAMTSTR